MEQSCISRQGQGRCKIVSFTVWPLLSSPQNSEFFKKASATASEAKSRADDAKQSFEEAKAKVIPIPDGCPYLPKSNLCPDIGRCVHAPF